MHTCNIEYIQTTPVRLLRAAGFAKVNPPLQRLISKNDQLVLVGLVADKVHRFLHVADVDPVSKGADVHHQVGEMFVLALSQHLLLSNVVNAEETTHPDQQPSLQCNTIQR